MKAYVRKDVQNYYNRNWEKGEPMYFEDATIDMVIGFSHLGELKYMVKEGKIVTEGPFGLPFCLPQFNHLDTIYEATLPTPVDYYPAGAHDISPIGYKLRKTKEVDVPDDLVSAVLKLSKYGNLSGIDIKSDYLRQTFRLLTGKEPEIPRNSSRSAFYDAVQKLHDTIKDQL